MVSLALVLALLSAPLWLVLAGAYDLVGGLRRGGRRAALGACLFCSWYLLCEVWGVASSAGAWLRHARDPAGLVAHGYELQRRWVVALFEGARKLLGIRMEASGDACLATGPVIIMIRHATVIDTLIPTLLGSDRHGLRLRFVLKRELLWDPCLDIVGTRLPNYFARRGGGAERELAGVRALATGLGPRDGLLIYPEGTRFTAAKRERILAKARERGETERLAYASALVNVLPPRFGGPLTLLDACEADVVFCAHTGLEQVTSLWDLWRGALRGKALRVHLWRVPRVDIPTSRAEREQWLLEQWRAVDEWISRYSEPGGLRPS